MTPNQGRRVLLVEDNPGDARLVEIALSTTAEKFDLKIVGRISDALDFLQREKADIILLDLRLPDSAGIETVRKIAAEHPLLPIVVLTGIQDDVMGFSAVENGAQDYLVKGQFTDLIIAKTIHYAIERQRIQSSLKEAESRYRGLVEASPDLIIIQTGGRITFINQTGLRLLRAKGPEDVLGKSVLSLVHPDFVDSVKTRFDDVERGRPVGKMFQTWVRLDGSPVDVEATKSLAPLLGQHAVQITAKDLTAQIETERNFAAIFHSNPLPSFLATYDEGRILDVNDRYCQYFGYSRQEMVGKTGVEIGTWAFPEDGAKFFESIEKDGLAGVREARFKDSAGNVKYALCSFEQMLISGTKVLVGMLTDITQRRETEERFRQLAENIREVFWMTDIEKTRVIYISPGYQDVWKRSCESLYLRPREWMDAILPEDRDRVIAAAMHQADGKYDEQYRIQRPDGGIRWIRDRAFPVRNEAGKVYRIVGISEDITEAKEAQSCLGTEQEKLRLVLQQFPLILSSVDRNLVITSSLGVGLASLGLKPHEVEGSTVWDLLGTRDPADPAVVAVHRALNGDSVTIEHEYKGIMFQSAFRPIVDASGNVDGAIVVTTDISERKRLEESLRQAQKMEAVGQLAGGVAHDFNNILNIIIGYSDFLAQRFADDKPALDDVEEIRGAAKRAASLTHQLLAFSRRQALQLQTLNLNKEISEGEKMLARLIGENIHWEVDAAENLWPIDADPGQIQQVLINLVVNARDAMPHGGTLSIRTANVVVRDSAVKNALPAGEYVSLAVSDTGEGMSAETRSRIFEPFFTTKPKGKGTGLGLSLVYGVVKQSGGHIFVESDLGKGAKFEIFMPKTASEAAKVEAARASSPSARREANILVVEDDPAVRNLLNAILRKEGFKVELAGTGKDALEIASDRGGSFDLLLSDVVLTDSRGDEIAAQISTRFPKLKILLISGYLDNEFGDFIVNRKIPFLQKPFSAAALTEKVHRVLSGA